MTMRSVAALGLAAACTVSRPTVEASISASPVRVPAAGAEPQATASFGWTDVVIDPTCTVRVATDPALLAIELPWRPCAAEPVGCRELSMRRPDGHTWIGMTGEHHRGAVLVAVTEIAADRLRHLVGPRDGAASLGIDGPRTTACSLSGIALGGGAAAVEIAFDNADGFPSLGYLHGAIGPDRAWTEVAGVLRRQDHPGMMAEAFASAGGRVYALANGGPLRWFDRAAGAWVEVDRRGGADWLRGGADVALFGGDRPWILRGAEEPQPLLDRTFDAAGVPALDGDRVAWIEGHGDRDSGGFGAVTLWTGTLGERGVVGATALVEFGPGRLGALGLGGGVIAVTSDDRRTLAVLRLGSNERHAFTTRGVEVIERLVWVAGDEVAVQVGPGRRGETPSRVLRLAVESLPIAGGP